MRKIKEVLRLKFELGLGLRQIARSCSLGVATVHEYLQKAKAADIGWPLPEDWDEEKLEAALFGNTTPILRDRLPLRRPISLARTACSSPLSTGAITRIMSVPHTRRKYNSSV